MDGIPDKRLIDLETRYAHLERHVEELSSVVAQQQTIIDSLVKRLGHALARINDLGSSATNERPPHY
jgi:uncharacterized coiled-coil protein SlyX